MDLPTIASPACSFGSAAMPSFNFPLAILVPPRKRTPKRLPRGLPNKFVLMKAGKDPQTLGIRRIMPAMRDSGGMSRGDSSRSESLRS